MTRIIAVLSMLISATAAGCGADRSPRQEAAVGTDAKTSSSPDSVLAGSRPADVTTLESHVAARMPRHDRALHRRLAAVINHESRHAGLDPLLVLALIHVESSFDPGAVSGAGAVGLMQLRGATLRQELERSGLAPVTDPLDPVGNVRAGIRYLRRLVRAFGSTELALMAYNAGPNRIGSYRRAGGIPERFYVYPRRIRGELERLRVAPELRRDVR
jgi:hypothetical protein